MPTPDLVVLLQSGAMERAIWAAGSHLGLISGCSPSRCL